ncbi:tudor domain-containing protein 5-like isoform X2 [Drosophila willistoni]|uniref:tudor domain-containing protein 5-like isoform X2 n=1 Tax=Drosophila willistoni TaxID=7260 RepID=UPI001F087B69|nr:tudor domain-containing protein 5-like isoform X2 [Drosophila willistoni]
MSGNNTANINSSFVQDEESQKFDSDDDGESGIASGTNPFTDESSEHVLNLSSDQEEDDKSDPEQKMNAFLFRLQSRMAVPDYALTDAVFCVDKPQCSISLGENLPTMDLKEHCAENALIKIRVTEVYSPFQFWFQLIQDENYLNSVNLNLNFYNGSLKDIESYFNHLPNYFIQPGYICVARDPLSRSWRRARIVSKPLTPDENIMIYYVDYGSGGEVPRTDLRFLSRLFAGIPSLALRGCLSHIHPLGPHWPVESIEEFKDIVLDREVYASVTECDHNDKVVFLRLSYNKDIKPSINRLMVEADLAGKSEHYSDRLREFNCGRRLRYLRERLPSFDMLENRAFPMGDEKFEEEFDHLIGSPSFYKDFEVPHLKNPFLFSLQKALEDWMVPYKKEEIVWRNLYKEANQKLEESFKKKCLV